MASTILLHIDPIIKGRVVPSPLQGGLAIEGPGRYYAIRRVGPFVGNRRSFALAIILTVAVIGLLGCAGSPPATDLYGPLEKELDPSPRTQALLSLRAQMSALLMCPQTLEITGRFASWVPLEACDPEGLRNRLVFEEVKEVRLVWEKVHLGRDLRWVEVLHRETWTPIGRGLRGSHRSEAIRRLESIKEALEVLAFGKTTPTRWRGHTRPYLF